MKVLFIVPYPTEGASNRYRVEQFFPFLKEKGIEYKLRPFISSNYFKIRYQKGNLVKKFLYFVSCLLKRLNDVVIRIWFYDLVFIHIEVFPFGNAWSEIFFAKFNKRFIFDFEDAIYLNRIDSKGKLLNWIKCPKKFFNTVGLAERVIVCNNYLTNFLTPYNKNLVVIPTSINTNIFIPTKKNNKIPVIGWIGSHSTLFCLLSISDVFKRLSKNYEFILKIIGGGENVVMPGVKVIAEKWSLKKEVENFQNLDIGVYPLPDDEWSLAKTPFKTIQYMSVGVPCVASSVGGNKDIIQDRINGFLVNSEDEWLCKLELLLSDEVLREKIGKEGRKIVKEKYSLQVNAQKFIETLTSVGK